MTMPAAPTLNPDEVQIGQRTAPVSTSPRWAPTSPRTPPRTSPTPWKILGYLSDDGPTVGTKTDSTEITPWQSVVPLRTVITSRGVTLQFVLWQINDLTVALYFDADPPTPDVDGSFSLDIRSDTPQHMYAVAIDSRDGDRVLRIGFPRATLSDAGDMQIQRGAAVPLDCTLSALDNAGVLATVQVGAAGAATQAVIQAGAAKVNGGGKAAQTAPAPAGR